jgi:hypothetical protein
VFYRFRNLCLSINFGLSDSPKRCFRFTIPFDLSILRNCSLKLNQQLQPSIEFHIHASILWKSLKIASGEGILSGNCFFQSNYLWLLFNWWLDWAELFQIMITWWFNPSRFSFCNEIEITLQMVNRHSTVTKQNLWSLTYVKINRYVPESLPYQMSCDICRIHFTNEMLLIWSDFPCTC